MGHELKKVEKHWTEANLFCNDRPNETQLVIHIALLTTACDVSTFTCYFCVMQMAEYIVSICWPWLVVEIVFEQESHCLLTKIVPSYGIMALHSWNYWFYVNTIIRHVCETKTKQKICWSKAWLNNFFGPISTFFIFIVDN